jgi:hypothetical protein
MQLLTHTPVPARREPQASPVPPAAVRKGAPVRTVTGVQRGAPGSSKLVVTSYDKRVENVYLAGEPDADAVHAELPHGCRPLAVQFELRPGKPRCTCVVTSAEGPRRVVLSLSVALALVAGGVHGIVTSVTTGASAQ